MILEKLVIKNFRQYYGEQTIDFSTDSKLNVTVIHGENGTGKSTLLNALTWCLYGKIDLPNPERLLSEKAEAEMKDQEISEILVELTFKDGDVVYVARRSQRFQKINSAAQAVGIPELKLSAISKDGKFTGFVNPEVRIDQLLPERMESYFFFDGEQIDNLAKEHNREEIVEAIQNLMGLETVERAIKHLQETRKEFDSEIKQHGSLETKNLIEQKQRAEKEIEALGEQKIQHEKNQSAVRSEIAEIDKQLKDLSGARELQEKREKLQVERDQNNENIKELQRRLQKTLSENGKLTYLPAFSGNVLTLLEASRKRGEVPAPMKKQFVQDLLKRKHCICGRPLDPDTEPYKMVTEWKERAGSEDFEDAVQDTASRVKHLLEERPKFFDALRVLQSDIERLQSKTSNLNEQLDEISKKLKNKDASSIVKLEEKRVSLKERLEEEFTSAGKCKGKIEMLAADIKEYDKSLGKIQEKEAIVSLAFKRMQACENARNTLQTVYDAARGYVRSEIRERVNRVLSSFLRKDFVVDLSENYELSIVRSADGIPIPAAMSQGERQIASLSFIGSLVDMARERAKQERTPFFRGGIYPILMDSPFGTLDLEYRRKVAEGLPELSHQVIVLVSSSQWIGEVENAMLPRTGQAYKLENTGKFPECTIIKAVPSGKALTASKR